MFTVEGWGDGAMGGWGGGGEGVEGGEGGGKGKSPLSPQSRSRRPVKWACHASMISNVAPLSGPVGWLLFIGGCTTRTSRNADRHPVWPNW